MNILGISGFENAMPFKRAHWPGLEEREYRISQGHDAAAALIIDGELVAAAAEERFDRQKHSAKFPIEAISYCLSEAGLSFGDIDELAHGFDNVGWAVPTTGKSAGGHSPPYIGWQSGWRETRDSERFALRACRVGCAHHANLLVGTAHPTL